MADLTPRMWVALGAMREHSDVAPPASEENNYAQPRRRAYAFHAADAIQKARLLPGAGRARRSATGAANTLIALRRRGLVAGGQGMAFDSAWWWITPEGAQALDERPVGRGLDAG